MTYKHSYYEKNAKRFCKGFIRNIHLIKNEIEQLIGFESFDSFQNEGLMQFKELLKQMQYVGGDSNRMTTGLVQVGYLFAIDDVLRSYDIKLSDVGRLVTILGERKLSKVPNIVGSIAGKYMYCSPVIKQRQKREVDSNRTRYHKDWISTIKVVENAEYDVMVEYTQCAIHLFAKKTDHLDILPYNCNLDYILYKKLGLGLRRTKTLAEGYDSCDFMISRKGDCLSVWPPQFLDESTEYR